MNDYIITRIEFHMAVDGRTVSAIFTRPEKIAGLMIEECGLGEWLRALRDSPEVGSEKKESG